MPSVFIDSNILLYARDQRNSAKQTQALAWIGALRDRDAAVINLQVVNEFIAVSLRKAGRVESRALRVVVEGLLDWSETGVDEGTVERAWDLWERTGYQWFDCLLLASALDLGCSMFLSEDMQHGHAIGGITIIDPFKSDRADVLARLGGSPDAKPLPD